MNRYAAELRSELTSNEPVMLSVEQSAESVAALLAAEWTGHPAALLPARLPPDEYLQIWTESGIPWLLQPGCFSQERWRRASTDAGIGDLSDIAFFQLTSGSTGASRLAARTRAGVLAELAAVGDRLQIDSGDRVLCASSIAHSYGLVGGLLAPLTRGAHISLATDAESAATAAIELCPAVLFALPPIYSRWADGGLPPGLSDVRIFLSAGSPLPAGLFDRWRERAGIPIRQDYGTTETGTITLDVDDRPHVTGVGRPLPHLEIRLAADGPPEVQVRGKAVARGYLVGGVLEPCTDDGGWYRTMDSGAWDGGQLCLGPRLREPLHSGHSLIEPARVEEALQRLPGVRTAIALSTHAADGHPAIRAVLVAPGLDASTAQHWCRAHLPPSWQPVRIAIVDALPRSPAGKVLHKYL